MMTEAESKAHVKSQGRSVASKVFDTEYVRLNPAQKQVVDTIEGPVMVVAGPGTGKTQVVAMRVASILKKTHARPTNILCLTFSKSGATAMRDRLRSIIGPDAYGVSVNTIHGFCNDIIIQHPSVFEDWSSLHPVSDVEKYREMNKIIEQRLPDLELVNLKSPLTRTSDILSRIKQLKLEGVTGEKDLKDIADQFDTQMSQKSKEGTKAHENNLAKARKFREFIELFVAYQKMLLSTNRYDYEDMILNVVAALKQEEWMLAGLQERYQYILVDEFQDTNGAQYELIELITTDPSADDQPNVCVVGDDDQAIYRFQGANLKNILSFYNRFPTVPVITLTQSYRCTQPILDVAGALIERNTERLVGKIDGIEKQLKSESAVNGEDPKLLLMPSDMAEPWIVADIVEERMANGVHPDAIAVIVRTNAELIPIYDVFQSRGIPVILSGKFDLLANPLVTQVISILKCIEEPRKNDLLASALSCECFGIHPADLAALYLGRRDHNGSLHEELLSLDVIPSMSYRAESRGEVDIVKLRNQNAVLSARDILLDLHNKSEHRTVIQTLEAVYRETGLLNECEKKDILNFAAAQEFFDQMERRVLENPHFSFRAFLNDLEFYSNPDYKDVRLSYSVPHLTQKGVQLLTAHKSKGLEFETVIITNFREGHWDKRRNPPSVSIPEDLLFGWEKDQKSYEQNQDERRLAYVAMTRAKTELIVLCPKELTTGDSTKAVSPSSFFAEAGSFIEEERAVNDPENMSKLLSVPPRAFDEEFKAFLRQKIENFALSPTSLNAFLEDPQKFLEIHLLEKPQAKEPHFAYGNAVHHALARWALNVRDGKPMDAEALISEFKKHMRENEILTKSEIARLDKLGEQSIPRYVEQRLSGPAPVIHKVEHAIRARIDDVPIKGKIDRIELTAPNASSAIIRDFKTGKPKTPKQCEDYGYVRQMVFYALLIEHGMGILKPESFIIDFIGEGSSGPLERIFTVSENEKAELKKLIKEVWGKILELDFTHLTDE